MSVLDVEELTVNYDKTPVLWDISFSIPKGKLVGILGPNGAGKSTLLKTCLGLIRPVTGKAVFLQQSKQSWKKIRSKIAYVPQRSSVDWDFPITVFDVVLMGRYGKLGFFKRPRAADKAAARQVLEKVGLTPFADRQISQLSGGQQQRLFIARALLQEAEIFLMDEPFAGVDIATEKSLILLFEQLKAEGKTLLVVHHDLNSVQNYFDWVIMLNTCLVACGPIEQAFTPDNILRTYGKSNALLDEAIKRVQHRSSGLK
jgi:manganese/zinc/iron transport system ATP- binding protein